MQLTCFNLGLFLFTLNLSGVIAGCVDAWDPKVLRGAMGGHFYTCILNNLPWENIANQMSSSSYLCIADTRKRSIVEKSFDASHPKVLGLLANADVDVDSSTLSDDETDTGEDSQTLSGGGQRLSENGKDEETDEDEETQEDIGNSWSKAKSESYKRVPLSIVPYTDMDCSLAEEVAVIIGGETEGISVQARKLAFEKYGQFVTIPMVEAVDSLNTATAAAIVLFEARRQLMAQIKRQRAQVKSGAS